MAESVPTPIILAVDIGAANTRASLFDIVNGVYRLVAHGTAPTTVEPPYLDISEGLRHALLHIQDATGRTLLNENSRLIMPATPDDNGVDAVVATASAGPVIRTALVGLLPEVSLDSARRTAETAYISVIETLSLSDQRREDRQIDALLAARPNLIIIAGGTDGGASEAVLRLTETVGLACHLMPAASRPQILYLGNAALQSRVRELLESVTTVHTAPNVRPTLEEEVIEPGRAALAAVIEELRQNQLGGFRDLAQLSGGRILPTAQAEGQIVHYLNRIGDTHKGTLAISIGSATTVVAAVLNDELHLQVCPESGVGINAATALKDMPLEHFLRWVPEEITPEEMHNFILHKSAYPHTLPDNPADLHLELALARQIGRNALRRARLTWPHNVAGSRTDLTPWFDRLFASGAVFGQAHCPGIAALLLLDIVLPTGITTLWLDAYHLLAAAGAIATVHPIAAAQILTTDALLNLGPAISLVGRARPGTVICEAHLAPSGGGERSVEVKYGEIEVLKLENGQTARLILKPRLGIDAGFGPGRSKTITVSGGAVGVILDGRGRPLAFPDTALKRRAAVHNWIAKVGGV